MAPKKRKAPENGCSVSIKKIRNVEASSSLSALPDPSHQSPISRGEDSSKIPSPNLSSKFAGLSDAAQSYSQVSKSAKESVEMELPESVSVLKFAECRANEISSLMCSIETKRPKLAFQQLPHHMRRRAASHNANRVPRRLREKVLKEIEETKKLKRPSRKHRRRPSNLLQEYNRRQRIHTWLETHIWFAKRFKMSKLWGYKIPLHPNDKSVRAGYRASSQHVLIQDLSYMCCIELVGLEQILLLKLSQLTSVSTGLTFASKTCLTGTREGSLMLYNCLSFPYQALGPISFLWCPHDTNGSNGGLRKLWIWCHPAMHQELIQVLKSIFDLLNDQEQLSENVENVSASNEGDHHDTSVTTGEIASTETEKPTKIMNSDRQKGSKDKSFTTFDKKLNFRFKRTICFSNGDVSLTLLKNALVRYRLIGPLSHAVIVDALKPADVDCNEPVAGDTKWWETFYSDEKNCTLHEEQKNFWSQMPQWKSPDEVPPKIILGLTVKDPRLDLPKIQKKISYEFNGKNCLPLNIMLMKLLRNKVC